MLFRSYNTGDGRTTIFDYWGVPEHQKWLNQGKMDGARLSPEQKSLRDFYARLLTVAGSSEAIRKGRFYELQDANNLGKEFNQRHLYAYLRFTDKQKLLVVVNFSAEKTYKPVIALPAEAMAAAGLTTKKFYTYTNLLADEEPRNALNLTLAPLSAYIFEIKPR